MAQVGAQQNRVPLGLVLSRRWPLILALAFGFLAAITANLYLTGVRETQAPAQMVTVVVARTDIRERAIIAADQLELRQMPAAYAHPRAAAMLADVVGRVALADIAAGEEILTTKFGERDARTGLSYVIPPSMRAITIAVSEVKGVGGFIAPGDLVDVIATLDLPGGQGQAVTKMIYQRIQVLATAQRVEERPGERPQIVSSITIAVTPQQAERIILADDEGRLRFALRPAGDRSYVPTHGAAPHLLVPAMADRFLMPATPQAASPFAPSPTYAARPALPAPTVQVATYTTTPVAARAPVQVTQTTAASSGAVTPAHPSPAVVQAAPAVTIAPPPVPTNMLLKGVLTQAGSQRQVALIVASGRSHIVSPGDTVDGWTVLSMTAGQVVLRRGETTYTLGF